MNIASHIRKIQPIRWYQSRLFMNFGTLLGVNRRIKTRHSFNETKALNEVFKFSMINCADIRKFLQMQASKTRNMKSLCICGSLLMPTILPVWQAYTVLKINYCPLRHYPAYRAFYKEQMIIPWFYTLAFTINMQKAIIKDNVLSILIHSFIFIFQSFCE